MSLKGNIPFMRDILYTGGNEIPGPVEGEQLNGTETLMKSAHNSQVFEVDSAKELIRPLQERFGDKETPKNIEREKGISFISLKKMRAGSSVSLVSPILLAFF